MSKFCDRLKNYIEKAKIVHYTKNKHSHGNEGGVKMNSLFPNLQAAMVQRGASIKNIADAIGLSEEITILKMSGVREWTLSEALTICRYLQYPDFRKLFLR